MATIQDAVDLVYFILGEPSEDLISQTAITSIVNINEIKYDVDTNFCELVYFSTLSCMEYIIRKLSSDPNKVGGVEREERRGKTQIRVKYDNNYNPIDSWKQQLKDFRNDPTGLLPCMGDIINKDSLGYLIFGGTEQSEVDRVENDQESYTVWDETFTDDFDTVGNPKRILRG